MIHLNKLKIIAYLLFLTSLRLQGDLFNTGLLLKGHLASIKVLSISVHGVLLSCDSARNCILWNSSNFTQIDSFVAAEGYKKRTCFSPDGQHYVFPNSMHSLEICNIEKGTKSNINIEGYFKAKPIFSPDGNYIWQMVDVKEKFFLHYDLYKFSFRGDKKYRIELSEDKHEYSYSLLGDYFSYFDGNDFYMLDANNGSMVFNCCYSDKILAVNHFCRNEDEWVALATKKEINIINTKKGVHDTLNYKPQEEPLYRGDDTKHRFSSLSISPSGMSLVVSYKNTSASLMSLNDENKTIIDLGEESEDAKISFSPAGTYIVVLSNGKCIIKNPIDGSTLQTIMIKNHKNELQKITSFVLSADDSVLITGLENGDLQMWNSN